MTTDDEGGFMIEFLPSIQGGNSAQSFRFVFFLVLLIAAMLISCHRQSSGSCRINFPACSVSGLSINGWGKVRTFTLSSSLFSGVCGDWS